MLVTLIIHQIFLLMGNWSKHITRLNIPQLKLWNIREYSSIFKTACVCCKKDLKDNQHNRTLSVLRSEQFFESIVRGKL